MSLLWTIFTILFGLSVGSFLNVVIYRLPRGQSIVIPRSFCPQCGRFVRWFDNIPLLSFLILHGKCRSCQKPISWQYPLVELLTGGLAVATLVKLGPSVIALLYFLLLVSPLIAITFIDLRHQIIPDVISLPGIGAGLLVTQQTVVDSLLGLAVGSFLLFAVGWAYEKTRKREGLGMGYVKLAAMLGAFFGWKGVLLILLLSSLSGSLVGLLLILIWGKGMKFAIPFGPFLALGALLHFFCGPQLIEIYLRFTQQILLN